MGSFTIDARDRSSGPVVVSGETGGEGNWLTCFGSALLCIGVAIFDGEIVKLSYGAGSGGEIKLLIGMS
jgi:hypothetical protein